MPPTAPTPAHPPEPLRVLVIGAGFGGVGMAIRLLRSGVRDFLVLERAGGVGGCWRDNTYPGAACDVPSHLYSFSFAPRGDWSRRFAPQAEILAYLEDCAERFGVLPHVRFHEEVAEARFLEAEGLWEVTTRGGRVYRARALVSAVGQLSRPAVPRVPGLERFRGVQFHSARWRHDVDLAGKRVAVVGTGASAIQFVPAIAPKVEKLFLFQRSAPWVLAKPDRPYRAWERRLKARVPLVGRLVRALQYLQHEWRVLPFSLVPAVMRPIAWAFGRHLRREVPDPALRARLTPTDPLGCKRILVSNDYYPALVRPNVEVVPGGVREVTEGGVVGEDGVARAVDVLLWGTGFTATEFLAPMRVHGLGGRELSEAWRDGAEAYLGVTVSGFPNLFLLYGPNTNLGHNSIVFMLESQVRYVLGCLALLERRRARWLDVREDAQGAFNRRLQGSLGRTVWAQGCTSWYVNEAGRNTQNWPGWTWRYRQATRAPKAAHYTLCP